MRRCQRPTSALPRVRSRGGSQGNDRIRAPWRRRPGRRLRHPSLVSPVASRRGEPSAEPELSRPRDRPALQALPTRRPLLVHCGSAASQRHAAWNARGCGSLTASPLHRSPDHRRAHPEIRVSGRGAPVRARSSWRPRSARDPRREDRQGHAGDDSGEPPCFSTGHRVGHIRRPNERLWLRRRACS